jgi:MFS family permease
VLIWTAGEMLQSPSNSTLIAELTPLGLRGRYQGVFSLSWSGAAFLAPTLGGYVQERAGSAALWLGCAIVAGIAAIGHVLAGPARERRVAALRAATPPAATPPTATPPTATPPVPAESAGAAAATDLTPAGGVTSDTLVSPGRHTYRRVDH